MKNINLLFFLFVLFLASCQKNQDVLESDEKIIDTSETAIIDFSWRASVYDPESVMHYKENYIALHNVTVKIMSRGVVIAQTNTSEAGIFEFDNILVPNDAYVLFESPGYHSTVVKVNEESMGWRLFMIRNTNPDITREIITTNENYIQLDGRLQELSSGREMWAYVTNDKDELVGTSSLMGDLTPFRITTLPGEELFLHYGLKCFPVNVIPIGSFTEDEDLGALLDQTQDFSFDYGYVALTPVNDCNGNEVFNNNVFYKVNGETMAAGGNRGVNIKDCYLDQPVLITVTRRQPRKYQEKLVGFSPGSVREDIEIALCEDDDTFVHYTIAGRETQSDIFTFANILSDGRLVIKQPGNDLFNDINLSMVSKSAVEGNTKGDVLFYFSYVNSHGGNELDFNITKNDGEFVEGTVSGELFDTEEISQGNFEATFRARIQ